ncbi:unnamed protein product [Dibothriocephalus latus]|uniref:Uncharacterized protein n=1 Tax=Dibothriocephalus latus TaxID=60516 RepID=A0A3P7MU48_DIBLA|nr:unnamed protein product [Dibothriocephalus latus]
MVAEKMAHLHTLPIRATAERFLSDTNFVLSEEPCVLKHIHRYIELLPQDGVSPRGYPTTAVHTYKQKQ